MPVTKRDVSPVDLSRHRLPPSVRTEELECVSNGTLANLIRQLSSLSAHAEDVFGELHMETVKVQHKTAMLGGRLEALSAKVGELDSALDEPSIQEFYLCKPFKSSLAFDQQPLSRHTLPAAMNQRYDRGDPPPDLVKLNCFREDGKNALKFYTDPDYFFELWRHEMLKDPENSRKVKVTTPIWVTFNFGHLFLGNENGKSWLRQMEPRGQSPVAAFKLSAKCKFMP